MINFIILSVKVALSISKHLFVNKIKTFIPVFLTHSSKFLKKYSKGIFFIKILKNLKIFYIKYFYKTFVNYKKIFFTKNLSIKKKRPILIGPLKSLFNYFTIAKVSLAITSSSFVWIL